MFLGKRFLALNGTAIAIGALAGLAAVFFRYAISLVERLAFEGHLAGVTPTEENEHIRFGWSTLAFLVILVPVVGGILVGLIRKLWPDTRQHGVTEVMASVQAKEGVLLGRTSWGHAIISALTVGTGGSTGREGPIGYIGAALGSSFGRRFKFNSRDLKVLLGCGFSAGIAASFNAPLGGVLMAIELIVPEFSTHAFIPLVLATVVGVAVGNLLLQGQATFDVPQFAYSGNPAELGVYLVLGILCGLASVGFIRHMTWTYNAWSSLPVSEAVRPVLGGLMVGTIGYVMFLTLGEFHVFGTGYATVTDILSTPSGGFLALAGTLVVLSVAKPVATAITVGSGGGGGMFSVSLFQGAVWGGLVGLVAQRLLPGLDISPASYALVGMGAFYAASTRATVTGIVVITELTRDYHVLLPLMLAAVVADAIAVGLSKDSLYTIKLSQKGIHYEFDRIQSPLDFLQVKDIMSKEVETLAASMPVGEAFNRMTELGHTGYPVVDPEGRLAGMVTRRDLAKHLRTGRANDPVSTVVSGIAVTAFPDEMLYRARDRIHKQDIGRLVVVDPADRRRIVGILTRSDVLRAEAQRDVEHEDAWNT